MSGEELPYAGPGPLGSARLRTEPEDFQVFEQLGFEPSGDGEHAFLRVRKRNWNTDAVAGQLARAAGVPRSEVSYAGMKDRRAVTEQWFCVRLPGRETPFALGALDDGIELLELTRNQKKLRRGVLTGNRFRLVLREVEASPDQISRQLLRIALWGVPNYFGEQRFGRGGDNVERAREMLSGRFRTRDRNLRGILLSSARSFLFNEVLAARLRDGSWDKPQEGDLMMLDGRHSLFMAEAPLTDLERRTVAMELHPSGPLPGDAGPVPGGKVAEREAEVLAPHAELVEGLRAARVEAARRPLRLRVQDLAWQFPESGVVELSFGLAAGGYATSVVREIFEWTELRPPRLGADDGAGEKD